MWKYIDKKKTKFVAVNRQVVKLHAVISGGLSIYKCREIASYFIWNVDEIFWGAGRNKNMSLCINCTW